jgi:hypothetical protein
MQVIGPGGKFSDARRILESYSLYTTMEMSSSSAKMIAQCGHCFGMLGESDTVIGKSGFAWLWGREMPQWESRRLGAGAGCRTWKAGLVDRAVVSAV